jgi:hypothetical protein
MLVGKKNSCWLKKNFCGIHVGFSFWLKKLLWNSCWFFFLVKKTFSGIHVGFSFWLKKTFSGIHVGFVRKEKNQGDFKVG